MFLSSETALIALAALLLDALVGDPKWLWSRLPHPVVLIGKLISWLDHLLNRPDKTDSQRRTGGVFALVLILFSSLILGVLLHLTAQAIPYGYLLEILIGFTLIAQRSLYDHVAAVRDGLAKDGLEGGRKAVAMIVGRDPRTLDEAGVSRAAIESCAENFSDGVVAPVFWFVVLGLPGLIAYKAINTADSMIGHKNERYRDFGWASARFDDLVNLPASRLSGLLISLSAPIVGGSPIAALKAIWRDADKHRSPNAGWPEAAMAGALNIALAGPRVYPGYRVDDPFMNETGLHSITREEISFALKILLASCTILSLLVLIITSSL